MDYTKGVDFSESETEDQPPVKLVEVSEKTKKFIQDKCTRRVSNAERKELRGHYPLPKVPATKTPQLDAFMKPEASTSVKATDKQLAKVQTLLLDSLAPLTSVVEAHYNGDPFDEKEVLQAVKAAVQLVGNANTHMSHLRRERVVTDLNKALYPSSETMKHLLRLPPCYLARSLQKRGRR